MSYFEVVATGVYLHCHVQPKASRDALCGLHNGRLKVQIAAPPVDGKANAHLQKFIAKCVGVAKSRVNVVQGHNSRQKTVLISDIDALPEIFP